MSLLATIKTTWSNGYCGEYDPESHCENLVRAEHKDLVMLLKESRSPRQSSSSYNSVN